MSEGGILGIVFTVCVAAVLIADVFKPQRRKKEDDGFIVIECKECNKEGLINRSNYLVGPIWLDDFMCPDCSSKKEEKTG